MSKADRDPLLEGLAEGRANAFAVLYDRFGLALFQVAYAMLGSRQDAEDAVQDLFVGLVRAKNRLSAVANLRAYLFASLRHSVIRLASRGEVKHAEQCPSLDRIPGPEPVNLETDCSVRLEQALGALPLEQREVISLKVDAGLTFAEIAAALGISANTAASRYRYALRKLRDALEG